MLKPSFLAILSLLVTLSSCAGSYDSIVGNKYYTQSAIHYEKDQHLTTNYRRGTLLPVNSEVTIKDMSNRAILFNVNPSAKELKIINVKKYTKKDIDQVFDRIFAKTKVDLSEFSNLEKANITNGTIAKGMSKKAVLAAFGYPPTHRTPNLDVDQWTYWTSRFTTMIVYFEKDKLIKIEN